jgi:hypothetical protein
MSTTYWIACHILNAAFWLWVLRFGGAEWLEGKFISGFLINYFAVEWSAEGIKFFAWVMLIIGGIGYLVGLFAPGLRCWSSAC